MAGKAKNEDWAIDRIRQKWSASAKPLAVPEWGLTEDDDGDHRLYLTRLTGDDVIKIAAKNPDTELEMQVLLLIHKARTVDGKPSFRAGDKQYLLTETDITVLRRVLADMAGTAVGVDDGLIDEAGVDAEAAVEMGQRMGVAEKN